MTERSHTMEPHTDTARLMRSDCDPDNDIYLWSELDGERRTAWGYSDGPVGFWCASSSRAISDARIRLARF